jgi:hypothetical protein
MAANPYSWVMRSTGMRLPILLLTVAVAYIGVWHAGFVWDDVPLVVQNQALGSFSALPSVFAGDLWASSGAGAVESGYYRPLVLLSFALDKALFGQWAPGYHLHNLLWHLAAVVMVHQLLTRLVEAGPALLGATLFALHPVQSEVVAWISARNDAMATALGLAAVVLVADATRGARVRWVAGAVLSCAAAWSKESAFLIPLLLLILDTAVGRGRDWHRYASLLAGLGVAALGRILAGVGGAAWPPEEGWRLVGQEGHHLMGVLAASIIWPWPISSLRDLHWMDAEPMVHIVVGWAAMGLGAAVLAVLQGRDRRVFAGGAVWAVASIALTLVPIADKGGFGDRFWYLPMVGVALMLAAVCPPRWGTLSAAALAVPALVVLHVRVPDWATDRSLWWSAIRDRPTPVNLAGFGHAQYMDQRYKRSLVAFTGALTTDRLANDACARVVASAVRLGRPALASRMGRWATARGCVHDGGFNGWMSTAMAFSGDWPGVAAALAAGPPDPKGRDQVAAAALATVNGDHEAVERIASSWTGTGDLYGQVARILANTPPTGDLSHENNGGDTP